MYAVKYWPWLKSPR